MNEWLSENTSASFFSLASIRCKSAFISLFPITLRRWHRAGHEVGQHAGELGQSRPIDCLAQGLASLERRCGRVRDGDGLSGPGIAALPGRVRVGREGPDACDGREGGIDCSVGTRAGHGRLVGYAGGEVGLVHAGSLPEAGRDSVSQERSPPTMASLEGQRLRRKRLKWVVTPRVLSSRVPTRRYGSGTSATVSAEETARGYQVLTNVAAQPRSPLARRLERPCCVC